MLTVAQCFSTLIASGNGKDDDGIDKLEIFKDGFEKNKIKSSKLSLEIASRIDYLYSDISDHYFVDDLVMK